MRRRYVVMALAVAAGSAGWYFFRPDRAFTNRVVAEAAPSGSVRVVRSGRFESRAHDGAGVVEVLALPDGRRVLRFSDFRTLDGPDLYVYLLGNPAAANARDLDAGGFLSLGTLKGNVGAQNYDIPAGTDLARYPAVAVWCRRFGVNFATAALFAPPGGS